MNTIFLNTSEIINGSTEIEPIKIKPLDKSLLQYNQYIYNIDQSTDSINCYCNIYSIDGIFLYSIQQIPYDIIYSDTGVNILSIKFAEELQKINSSLNRLKIGFYLENNIIGDKLQPITYISDISSSRTEVKLKLLFSNSYTNHIKQLTNLKSDWYTQFEYNIKRNFILKFISDIYDDIYYDIINIHFNINNTNPNEIDLILKLYTPVSPDIGIKSKVYIAEELITPIIDDFIIKQKKADIILNTIKGPNFELNNSINSISDSIDYSDWNDILSINNVEINTLYTSQQILDTYFGDAINSIKLNINFKNFNNYIHFSSAVERIKNFKYKLQLIEYYTTEIINIIKLKLYNDLNVYEKQKVDELIKKRNLITSGFDDFEQYLFYTDNILDFNTFQIKDNLYTHNIGIDDIIPGWPKESILDGDVEYWNAIYFKNQYKTDSAIGESYFNYILEKAEIYDAKNIHKLTNTIPLYLHNNNEYHLFINMISQHFDILWVYIHHLQSINFRDENPKDGPSDAFLYDITKALGMDLLEGNATVKLLDFLNIKNESSISSQNVTHQIWRRILNNLPFLLKSKGTKRGIKALITCFGIPDTHISVNELGNPLSIYNPNIDKIRITDNNIIPDNTLYPIDNEYSYNKSSLIKESYDSNKIAIYFSPYNHINSEIKKIPNLLKIVNDYIGDPSLLYKDTYQEFIQYHNTLLTEPAIYNTITNFSIYFNYISKYDFTLFKYIDTMLPGRSIGITGAGIDSIITDRKRMRLNKKPEINNLTINDTGLNMNINNISANIVNIQGHISDIYNIISYNIKNTISGSITYSPLFNISQNKLINIINANDMSASMLHINSTSNGSTMKGRVNIDSSDTIDGGPIIRVIKVNPNDINITSATINTNHIDSN